MAACDLHVMANKILYGVLWHRGYVHEDIHGQTGLIVYLWRAEAEERASELREGLIVPRTCQEWTRTCRDLHWLLLVSDHGRLHLIDESFPLQIERMYAGDRDPYV